MHLQTIFDNCEREAYTAQLGTQQKHPDQWSAMAFELRSSLDHRLQPIKLRQNRDYCLLLEESWRLQHASVFHLPFLSCFVVRRAYDVGDPVFFVDDTGIEDWYIVTRINMLTTVRWKPSCCMTIESTPILILRYHTHSRQRVLTNCDIASPPVWPIGTGPSSPKCEIINRSSHTRMPPRCSAGGMDKPLFWRTTSWRKKLSAISGGPVLWFTTR